eukprot:gene5971-6575_t
MTTSANFKKDSRFLNHGGIVKQDTVLADAGSSHSLVFAIQQKNVDQLHSILMDISTPSSPNYGQHWTRQQVSELTSNAAGMEEVVSFLRRHEISVDHVSKFGEYVVASAPVSLWEVFFKTRFEHFYDKRVRLMEIMETLGTVAYDHTRMIYASAEGEHEPVSSSSTQAVFGSQITFQGISSSAFSETDESCITHTAASSMQLQADQVSFLSYSFVTTRCLLSEEGQGNAPKLLAQQTWVNVSTSVFIYTGRNATTVYKSLTSSLSNAVQDGTCNMYLSTYAQQSGSTTLTTATATQVTNYPATEQPVPDDDESGSNGLSDVYSNQMDSVVYYD